MPFFFFIKNDKIGSMPYNCCVFIDIIKTLLFTDTNKVFYAANLFLPLALLADISFLPFFVFILVLKPCVLLRGVLCG